MKASGFVAAGLPSLQQHLRCILKYNPDCYTNETLNKFLLNNCNKFLSSVGTDIDTKKPDDINIFKRYQNRFDRFKKVKFLNGCDIILDSAGFQFQCGILPKSFVPSFINGYHDFLIRNHGKYSQAFVFDPVPGSTKSIIDSYEEMKSLNLLSYMKAANLPDNVRKNIMYIHHFRTPKINKLFKEMMFEYNLSDGFTCFATGGLVSFNAKAQGIPPCNMYVIPLIDILTNALKNNLKSFRFHVLGDSDWKSVFFHRMVEKHIKEIYDIDVTITYDSTTIQKTFMIGRYMFVPHYDNKSIWKMFLRSEYLHMQWKDKGTVLDYYYFLINEMSKEYGFKRFTPEDDPIYTDKNIVNRVAYALAILQTLKLFKTCSNWCEEFVDELYPLYKDGQTIKFDLEVEKIMLKFNNGKMSNSTSGRTSAMYNSLKMLEQLDIDHCNYLVDRYMSADEAGSLKDYKEFTF